MIESLTKKIKNLNSKTSDSFAGKSIYWMRSPSNILLKSNTEKYLKEYSKGETVLDAGAGRLAYKSIVAKYFKKYFSTDFVQTHPDLYAVNDITEQPFKDNELNFIFCSQVLEHVPKPWEAFEEFNRILKPKGRLLLTVPMLGYIHNAPYDFYRYTKFGIENLAELYGFNVIKLEAIGGFFSFLGYIRSTILIPFFRIPLLGQVLLGINYCLSYMDIALDTIIPNKKIFPLNYIAVLEKKA